MRERLRRAWQRLGAAAPVLARHGSSLAWRTFELARAELAMLATLFLCAAALWTFVTLADEVGEGETRDFDEAVILALRNPADLSDPIGPRWFEEMVRDVTALGSMFVLTFMTAAVIGFLLLMRRYSASLLVLVSVAGGALLGDALKLLFERPRPDLVPHGAEVYTLSFPSNHAMGAAVTYLTLGALLARLELRPRVKLYFLTLSVLLAALVGVSRVYLGVHWPTDVLAGWSVGAAWAMGVWLVALALQRRGKVEPPGRAE